MAEAKWDSLALILLHAFLKELPRFGELIVDQNPCFECFMRQGHATVASAGVDRRFAGYAFARMPGGLGAWTARSHACSVGAAYQDGECRVVDAGDFAGG